MVRSAVSSCSGQRSRVKSVSRYRGGVWYLRSCIKDQRSLEASMTCGPRGSGNGSCVDGGVEMNSRCALHFDKKQSLWGFLSSATLQMWLPDQQHQYHLETGEKYKFSLPRLAESESLGLRPSSLCFISLPDDCNASWSLRISLLAHWYHLIFLLWSTRADNTSANLSMGTVRCKNTFCKALSGEYTDLGLTESWHWGHSHLTDSEANDLGQLFSNSFC